MSARLQKRGRHREGGFTLVELLVVVVILGVLAAIVVFAVGGVRDQGAQSACKADTAALAAAEEAYFGSKMPLGVYTAQGTAAAPGDLVAAGFLHEAPTLHTVTIGGSPAGRSYTIVDGGTCGAD
jgi:general secretion pathway protein G